MVLKEETAFLLL